MATLRVRTYSARFGDTLLVSVPDQDAGTGLTTVRHVLIDAGHVLVGEDPAFRPVLEDVLTQLDGAPLDLYVLSHEHLDSVQGSQSLERLKLRHAWLTASAAPDYSEQHGDSARQLARSKALYDDLSEYCRLRPEAARGSVQSLLLGNDYRKAEEHAELLRGLAEHPHYVCRGAKLEGTHPFKEAKLEVWAPEAETREYTGRVFPVALGLERRPGGGVSLHVPTPPAGVDASAFYNLLSWRRQGMGDDLLAIDTTAKNMSIVFSLEWRGWRLLFAGDAGARSWTLMKQRDVLRPVHFLQAGDHGTPGEDILDAILPVGGDTQRYAVISEGNGVARLRSRCLPSTPPPGALYMDLTFEDRERPQVTPRTRRAVPARAFGVRGHTRGGGKRRA
ncbi:hypothetical protein JY651_40695 [Pyxidicoccus parkwayensis]|uniref:Metallo-beta-lactamase domain-containing protein n=1 Tax=Pyxidicoccus parkwayensis TaxID=2813578 RepID=A0ABX7NZE6_9BACT|nr:hypothetical protein [Pyxidicoccus parkwaysis]QSQ21443.1 hypothetical protein JY651_40695 [Pyxidicoccus parkwaysis]